MEDLIAALQIFLKYGNPKYPTHCSHDLLTICGIDADTVSATDVAELEKLGFYKDYDNFYSTHFGSC